MDQEQDNLGQEDNMPENEKMELEAPTLSKTLFISLGNEYRSDDAVGLFIGRSLLDNELFSEDNVVEAGMNLMAVVDRVDDPLIDQIFIIDSAQMGVEPGQWEMLNVEQVSEPGFSTHENNLQMFISYLASKRPDVKVRFVGIQPQSMEMSESMQLTEPVLKGAEQLVQILAISYALLRRTSHQDNE